MKPAARSAMGSKGPLGWLRLALGLAVLAGAAGGPVSAQDVMGATGVKGAGSTFAYPLISRWSVAYRADQARGRNFPAANSGLDDPPASSAMEYEPVGSLAGMLRVKVAAVDFAASDVPLKSAELSRLGLGQFPVVVGGIVAVVNIDGIGPGQLKLTGPILADIFLSKIKVWTDPAIQALNPTLKLPDTAIAVVHRSDGSGTTFNFTNYLAKVSPQWKERVGSDLLVPWPTGAGAKGNKGMSQAIKEIRNSIGYVEFASALQAKLSFAQLQNQAGRFVQPSAASFQAASAGADWATASDFDLLLTDAPGPDAYPIVATVFVLMQKAASPAKAGAVLDYFSWSLDKGAPLATQLGYVPLPEALVKQVKSYWVTTFKWGK
jgi:phosphate transport system substrate-binding protein